MSDHLETSNTPAVPSAAILVDRLHVLIRTRLWPQILVAMFLGVATGLALSPSGFAFVERETAVTVTGWLALPGHVFLALIKMMMVPLVMSSIVLGIASSNDPAQLRGWAGPILITRQLCSQDTQPVPLPEPTILQKGG